VGINLLGPVVVDGDGALRPRDRVALAALAVRRGQAVAPDQLADALWGEDPPPSWPKQVQICVARLRKVLGPLAIETAAGGYRLCMIDDDIDVDRFEQLVERGRMLAATDEPDRAASTFARALSLWRGPPFENLGQWPPGRSEAARLDELRRSAEEDLLDARLAGGEHREVAAEAETLVAEEPLRERRWAILALAQYRCGRQADALRSLDRARRRLVDQLGIDPGAELAALEAAILRQDVALNAAPAPPVVSEACPYKGLAPYDVGDTESFFGRDAEVATCLERLRSTSLVVVAGPSGCGKSSLVRAGLVPALRRRGRTAIVFVPGADPEAALSNALATTEGTPVLVIDQFEELFALDTPTEAVRAFSKRIVSYTVERAPVVIAVRADHIAGLSADPDLSRLAEQGLHLVRPLAGDELREAIEEPANQAGLRLEHGLVDLLIRDTEGEPGALPLLSHALAETWRRRDGHVLTVEGYRATGGIRGAVARSADRLYDSLPPDQRATLRSVLLRLVAPSLDGDPVRYRVPSHSLLGDPGRERVVALLVRSRLVTSEADTFELAHEALARAWPRLQSWLEDDTAGQRILRHLGTAADEWQSLGRPASELYRGARLDTALEWQEATQPDLTDLERAFVAASVDHAQAESRAQAERARRDARQNRRLRWLLAATAIFLVAALVAGLVARGQRDVAEREGRVATARELAAAATANLDVDPERSVLLALAAIDHTRSADGSVLPEAEQALHWATTMSRVERRVSGGGGSLDWSPDGGSFVTEGPEGSGVVDIRDVRSGDSLRSFPGHDGDMTGVAFNHDGTLLATTGDDGAARVWDPQTGEELHTLRSPGGTDAWGPSFSVDGSRLAATWPDEDLVQVYDLASERIVREVRSVPVPYSTSFDPAGARIAVASDAQPAAVVLDLSTGDQLLTLEGHEHALEDVAWSPDGASIATAGVDGSSRVFDASTGRQRFALNGHRSHVFDVDWSPDATHLVTASDDGTAKIWFLIGDSARNNITLSAQDTRNGVLGVAYSPDGSRLMTGNVDRTATTIWDVSLTGEAEVANFPAVMLFYPSVTFTRDGRRLLATGAAGTVNVWDVQQTTGVATLGAPTSPSPPPSHLPGDPPVGADATDFTGVEVSRDGRLVAGVRFDGTVRVLDTETGQEAFAVPSTGASTPTDHVAWSPTDDLLAVAGRRGDDEVVAILDPSGRQVAVVREDPGFAVRSVAFSPDGRHLLTSRVPQEHPDPTAERVVIWDWERGDVEQTLDTPAGLAVPSPTGDLVATAGTAQAADLWSSTTGRHMATLVGHTGAITDLAFSVDGSRLATASADGTVRLWDPDTGEQQLVLRGHIGLATSVSFSPDGSQLASTSADGSVRIWALDLDDLIEIAQSELTRSLTDEECQQYQHVNRCPYT
jgi:WD40 repeat protein/DNA-binding SARP family transcriptional activator